MRGRAPKWRCLCVGACVLLALGALAAALAWPAIFDSVFASQLALKPGSRSFESWRMPSVPLYFEVFLFNWTNAHEFPQVKPRLEQLGPYRFKEHREHVNITWHKNNNTLAYRTFRKFQFDALSSNGTLEDNITTLNVIAASAAYRSRDWGFLRQKGLSMGLAMFGQTLAVSRTAGEFLFEGYEDPLLDLAKSLPSSTTGGAPPIDKFGWFNSRNNSLDTDGYVEVSMGFGDLPGQIKRWNFQDHLPYYDGKCSKLAGSVGEFLPRTLTEQSSLTMFVMELCRTVHMDYVDSGAVGGLQYHKYALADRSFDNSTGSSECFCVGECPWSGVMNVSACRYGSPAVLTLPHFLHADPQLFDMVDGMEPDEEKHSFYFAVEPKLGIPVDVAARFQFNIFMEPNPNIALFENVPKMLFPILWVQQQVQIDEQTMIELRAVRAILDWGATVCACAAVVFAVLIAIISCCTTKSQYKKPEEVLCEKPKDEAEVKLNPLLN